MIAPRYPPTMNLRSTAPAEQIKAAPAVNPEGETDMKPQVTLHVLSTRQQLHIAIQDKLIKGRCAEPETDVTHNIYLSQFLGYQLGV